MGSIVWFKNIISRKKSKGIRLNKLKKHSAPENISGIKDELCLEKGCCSVLANGASVDNQDKLGISLEDAAATRIQTAVRAYLARKTYRKRKGMVRLQKHLQCDSVKNQASTTLGYLHTWSRTQSQVRERRTHMVTEGRLKQQKLDNQLKLEAKLHDLESEWSGGSDTFSEALAKIHNREEAAVRRVRAMAYAFSHQWRANSNTSFGSGNNDLSKANWGWSWMDRWIAARPWESRMESPKKSQSRLPNKSGKSTISPTSKTPNKVKLISPNGKAALKARKLSYGSAEKTAAQKVNPEAEKKNIKIEKEAC